jgi:hypothetical protein
MPHSSEDDQSERQDLVNNAFHYLFDDTPIPVNTEDLCKLITEVSGHIYAYTNFGILAIIERFDEIKTNSEQPHKATLEFVIDSNPDPDTTVYSYLKEKLV